MRRATWILIAVAATAALLAALWRFTPLSEAVEPEAIRDHLAGFRDGPWAVPAVWLAFVVSGFLLVPLNAMFLAVGLSFDFLPAVGLSLSGALWSALFLHQTGRWIDIEPLLRRAPERLREIQETHLEDADVPKLAMLRFLPLGPFTTMNLLWGAAGVSRRRLLAASLIGLVPGAVLTAMLGRGIGMSAREPGVTHVAVAVAAGIAMLAMVWLGKRVARTRTE